MTSTSTGPFSFAGVTTRILLVDAMMTLSTFLRPKRTSACVFPGWNPPPLIVISSPPAVVPCGGSTESTLRGPFCWHAEITAQRPTETARARARFIVGFLRGGRGAKGKEATIALTPPEGQDSARGSRDG